MSMWRGSSKRGTHLVLHANNRGRDKIGGCREILQGGIQLPIGKGGDSGGGGVKEGGGAGGGESWRKVAGGDRGEEGGASMYGGKLQIGREGSGRPRG